MRAIKHPQLFKFYAMALVGLGAAYCTLDGHLFGQMGWSTPLSSLWTGTSVNVQGTYDMGDSSGLPGDVPSSTVAAITSSLQNVAGLEELVVLPMQGQNGYTVSTMVNLGPDMLSSTVLNDKVRQEVGEYFTGLFTSGQNVINGELYFTEGGQIIATAGLGLNAYHAMNVKTGTTPSDFAQALAEEPTVTDDGANASWYELNEQQTMAP